MWSLQKLRESPETTIATLARRGKSLRVEVENILSIDTERRSLQTEYDELQTRSRQLSKQLGEQIRRKPQDPMVESLREEAITCRAKASAISDRLQILVKEQKTHLLSLPNAPHSSTPEGQNESQNKEIRSGGPRPTESDRLLPHWDLFSSQNGLDFEAGSKVTGSGFLFYKGQIARLVRGLIYFFLEKAREAGYEEIMPPLLVGEDAALGTGQLPDKEGQMYRLEEEPYYLIPTAEVPITNLYREKILPEQDLPLRYVGYTPCFRREAGSWGRDVRGLNRLHQFDKVEIVQICNPLYSYEVLEKMVSYVESLLEELELPYRLVQLCTGDLGFAAALTYDFEVYASAQKKWLEVSSVSNFEAFQARRMQLRYRSLDRVDYPHTLNGSALAIPRVLAALLEQGQRKDEIRLPKALVSYTGFSSLSISSSRK